jgi:short-subunit dehydrogenase
VELRGATCLVTGGSSGIGRATVLRLVGDGARVLALGRDEAALAATGATPIVCDLADPAAFERAAAQAGAVDVLVNNAGIGRAGRLAGLDGPTLETLVRVNLVAPLQLTRALLPAMLARGRGRVVLVGSIVGVVGARDEAAYAATKGGLVAFAESLRQECRGTGVGVTLVTPGVVATRFFERRDRPYDRRFPRPVAAEAVADAIVDAVRRDRDDVFVPRWLALPPRVHALAPRLYRALAARFG